MEELLFVLKTGLKVADFKALIRNWWTCNNFVISYSHIIVCKAKGSAGSESLE